AVTADEEQLGQFLGINQSVELLKANVPALAWYPGPALIAQLTDPEFLLRVALSLVAVGLIADLVVLAILAPESLVAMGTLIPAFELKAMAGAATAVVFFLLMPSDAEAKGIKGAQERPRTPPASALGQSFGDSLSNSMSNMPRIPFGTPILGLATPKF